MSSVVSERTDTVFCTLYRMYVESETVTVVRMVNSTRVLESYAVVTELATATDLDMDVVDGELRLLRDIGLVTVRATDDQSDARVWVSAEGRHFGALGGRPSDLLETNGRKIDSDGNEKKPVRLF